MKVETVAGPSLANSQSNTQTQQDARARAIAKLSAPQAQEHPVQDPTRVAPEDLSAVKAPEGQGNVDEVTALEPEAPAVKEKELLSTQYAQLARREKALQAKAQAQQRAIAEREAALQAREAAITAKDSEYQSKYIPKDRLSQDTINVLLENGISYDQITQMMLTQQQQDPATKLAIQRLEDQLRAQTEERQQEKTAQYQQAVKQIRFDAQQLVRQDNEFETIRETNSINDVVELIEETFKEDGTILSVDEACRLVEDHLVEKLSKYSRLGKIQQRLKAAAPAATSPKQPENTSQQHQPKPTLTNAAGTSKKLTTRERAILAMEGKLQK